MENIIKDLSSVIESSRVVTDVEIVKKECENTLCIDKKVDGILYPNTVDEVIAIQQIANKHKLKLHPISRGKNIGYGEKTPANDGEWVVNLSGLNKIRHLDKIHGYIEVEPGVTQEQLYEYLKENKSQFWMDPTGAGLDSSILGNTAEGGFGHTPKGNHRRSLREVEIVLGTGKLIRTEQFPGMGPDLSGIFIQSNFGIITSVTLELMPIPEYFESFLVQIKSESHFGDFINTVRRLRLNNTLTSVVHMANALRTVISSIELPESFNRKELVSEKAAIKMLQILFVKGTPWSATGGLYGSRSEVRLKKKILKKEMRKIGRVIFFTDTRLSLYEKLLGLPFLQFLPIIRVLRADIESYTPFHNLLRGIPSNGPLKNIKWKAKSLEETGLIWIGPTVPATPSEARKVISVAKPIFAEYGFEMPITFSFIDPTQLIGIFSINFIKQDEEEKARAHKAYHALLEAFKTHNIRIYRASLVTTGEVTYEQNKTEVLSELKKVFDPNNTLDPGRYGIRI